MDQSLTIKKTSALTTTTLTIWFRTPLSCCATWLRHVSTVAQNGQIKTLAQDRAFGVFMTFDGHCMYLHVQGVKCIQLVAIQQLHH